MDETNPNAVDDAGAATTMGRRAFFGRTLLAAGSLAGLVTLTGCPGGGGDDDDDDDGGDDDD